MAPRAVLLVFLPIFLMIGSAGAAPTFDEIASMSTRQRENALAIIRSSSNGEAELLALETIAGLRADERRQSGQPPLFPGCLRSDEFEIATSLSLARASLDARAFRVILVEFRRLSGALEDALAYSRSSGDWHRRFAHLGHWIEDWRDAGDADTRELLRRTLNDQALRASLSTFEGAKIYGRARPTAALRAYNEYVFNLMCSTDEDNLRWLEKRIAARGWFDIGEYGWAADHAAYLMVQHADGDTPYQAHIAALLASKLATGDTNPQNYAHLVDGVAVRSGRAQMYGTQMECVDGTWLAPNVVAPARLEERRAGMGLPTYEEQLARGRHLCQKARARPQ
jgi:hypothetical protein